MSGTFGHSAITSLISGDRSAVSIAQRVRSFVGGSRKMHDERRWWGSAKGVGQLPLPIQAIKKGSDPVFVLSQALDGEV
jgi:hypothetical protein